MQALKNRFSFRSLAKLSHRSAASCACSSRSLSKYEINVPIVPKEVRLLLPISSQSRYSLSSMPSPEVVDSATFERACEETLESLTDYFEELVEESDILLSADVSYSTGVLTINLGKEHGTYVINRQSPNKQIWLSSPISGPKRYDFIPSQNCWVYKHTGETLHCLLQYEISKIVKGKIRVDFSACSFAKL